MCVFQKKAQIVSAFYLSSSFVARSEEKMENVHNHASSALIGEGVVFSLVSHVPLKTLVSFVARLRYA